MVDTIGLVNAVAGAPSYNGRMLRQLNGVGFAGATAARPLGARSGVRPGTPATTVSVTSTTWTCQPFAGLLDGQAAAESGPYAFAFDAVATGAVAAASASIARKDIIYVQIDDPSESDGSTVPAATRKYLAGTVASTPPATPARSIVIAHINVPISGGGSPAVTWVAPYCAAAGGTVDFNTKAELDLWTTATTGQMARVLADGLLYQRSGSAWVGLGGDTGWITMTMGTNVNGGVNPVQYRRIGPATGGLVMFRGRTLSIVGPLLLGTMPVDFRPDMLAGQDDVTIVDHGGVGRLNIQRTGALTLLSATSGALSMASVSYISRAGA